MPIIKILPHAEYCPQGKEIEAPSGTSVCEALLDNHIEIEHACELSCACTTCHVIVREGFASLGEMDESEEDLLDAAERATIDDLVARVRATARDAGEPRAIEAAVEALADGTEGFAAARMNRGIRDALAGRNVNDL